MRRWPALALVFAASLCAWAPAGAEQAVREGPYVIHYAATPTTALDADVARRFDVTRSRRRSLLVINAQRQGDDPQPESIPATGSGSVSSLIGQTTQLALRPAREGDVHYLLAEFVPLDKQVMRFSLDITPQGASRPIRVEFHQQFFHD